MQNTDQIPDNKFRLRDIFNLITLIGLLFLMIGIILMATVPSKLTPAEQVLDKQTVQSTLVSVKPYTEKVPEKRYGKDGSEYTVFVTKTEYLAEYECTLDGAPYQWADNASTSNPPQMRTVTFYKTKDGWTTNTPLNKGSRISLKLVFVAVSLLGAGFTALGIWIGLPSKPKSSKS